MKYYTNTNNEVFAFEPDGSQDSLISLDMIELTGADLVLHLSPKRLPKQLTSLEYLGLFSEEEQIAVVSATMVVSQIKLWYDKMLAAGYVTSADPRTEEGLAALVGAGLLTEARKVEILGVMA